MKDETLLLIAGVAVAYFAWPKTAAAAGPAPASSSGPSLASQIAAALKQAGLGGEPSKGGGSSPSGGGGGAPSGGAGGSPGSGGGGSPASGGRSPSTSTSGPVYGPANPTVPIQPVLTKYGTYAQTPDGGYVTEDGEGNYVDEYGNYVDPASLSDSGVYANMPADYGLVDDAIIGYDYVGLDQSGDSTDTSGDTTTYDDGSGGDYYDPNAYDYSYDT